MAVSHSCLTNLFPDAEDGEVDRAVGTVFHEAGKVGEVVFFRVLYHYEGARFHQA